MDPKDDARHLLGSVVLRNALRMLDDEIVHDWRSARDPVVRERLWIKQQLLGEITDGIRKFATEVAK